MEKNWLDKGLAAKKERERRFEEKDEILRPKKDTIDVHVRMHRAWYLELIRLAGLRTASDDMVKKVPWTPQEMIREAIAKAFFLCKGESPKRFREEWTGKLDGKQFL